MATVREIAAKNIEWTAPYFFQDKSVVLGKTGNVKQSGAIKRLIKKNASGRCTMSGISVYVLRVDSYQIGNCGGCSYLAFNEYTGAVTLHNA